MLVFVRRSCVVATYEIGMTRFNSAAPVSEAAQAGPAPVPLWLWGGASASAPGDSIRCQIGSCLHHWRAVYWRGASRRAMYAPCGIAVGAGKVGLRAASGRGGGQWP